jgi:hypothetical protein
MIYPFRPKGGLYLEQHFDADSFHRLALSRGDVRASLAPG